MVIETEDLGRGSSASVRALVVDGRSEILDFLNELPHDSFAKLQVLIGQLAEYRFLANQEKFRRLAAGIYELKLRKPPVRLFCFQDGPNWICTHGDTKPGKRELQSHVAKVQTLRRRYFEEKS